VKFNYSDCVDHTNLYTVFPLCESMCNEVLSSVY